VFYTYSHATPEGRIFYIGKGQGKRAYVEYGRTQYWKNVVAKHGKPVVQILANWKTEAEALDHEILLIDCFRDMGYKLVNLTDGGEGVVGLKHTQETKKKMSISKTGVAGHKCAEETKERLRKINLGKKHSEETKKKLSEHNKGMQNSLGYKHTDEAKIKIGLASKGNKYAVGNTSRRKWVWVGTEVSSGKTIELAGIKAIKDAGFQEANIIKCIKGIIKVHKGYTWTKKLWENKSWH
jgi:hypothetical protein